MISGSGSESLLHLRISQPNISQCSSQNGLMNHLRSQQNSVSSSHSLPGFSQSCQPELRNVPVYSQSHMPRTENNPMLSQIPLPTANFSSVPYVSSSSYQQLPGYFPPYSSLLQPNQAYSATIQQPVFSSALFSYVAQGNYSMQPPGPQTIGPSYSSLAPSNVAPPRPPALGRFDFSVPGSQADFSTFERSSLTREKHTPGLFVKWHITFKGDWKRDSEGFLANLTRCKETDELKLDEINKALPYVLDEEAWQWFRTEYQFWKSYEVLVEAFRLQYSFEDVQERLRKELEGRTYKGPNYDRICNYFFFKLLVKFTVNKEDSICTPLIVN